MDNLNKNEFQSSHITIEDKSASLVEEKLDKLKNTLPSREDLNLTKSLVNNNLLQNNNNNIFNFNPDLIQPNIKGIDFASEKYPQKSQIEPNNSIAKEDQADKVKVENVDKVEKEVFHKIELENDFLDKMRVSVDKNSLDDHAKILNFSSKELKEDDFKRKDIIEDIQPAKPANQNNYVNILAEEREDKNKIEVNIDNDTFDMSKRLGANPMKNKNEPREKIMMKEEKVTQTQIKDRDIKNNKDNAKLPLYKFRKESSDSDNPQPNNNIENNMQDIMINIEDDHIKPIKPDLKEQRYNKELDNEKFEDKLKVEEKFYTEYIKDCFYSSVFDKPLVDIQQDKEKQEKAGKHFLIVRELNEPNTE